MMNKVRERALQVVQDPFLRWPLLASFVCVLLTLALPLWKILPLAQTQPFIPLHYNVYFGVDRFGAWQQAFVLPALAAAILFVNTYVSASIVKKERAFAYFFSFGALFVDVLLLAGMILLLLLNL